MKKQFVLFFCITISLIFLFSCTETEAGDNALVSATAQTTEAYLNEQVPVQVTTEKVKNQTPTLLINTEQNSEKEERE